MKFFISLIFLFCFLGCSITPTPSPVDVNPDPLPENTERICVIGDGGTGPSGYNGVYGQRYVSYALQNENCTRVLYTGDVIYENGIDGANDRELNEKFMVPYKELLDKKIPFYMSMGNHDWYSGENPVPVWKKIADKHDSIIYDNISYVRKFNNICIMQIDTNKSKYFKLQKDWFKDVQENKILDDCKFAIAFAHHPYYSFGAHGSATGSLKDFINEMVLGKFDVYLTGHEHYLSDEGLEKGTRLLISGAAGKNRSVKKSRVWHKEKVFGYVVIEYSGGESASYFFKTVDKDFVKVEHSGMIKVQGFR